MRRFLSSAALTLILAASNFDIASADQNFPTGRNAHRIAQQIAPPGQGQSSSPDDPYIGSGMTMPVMSPQTLKTYDPHLFDALRVGSTTKSEVINALGKPGAWNSDKDGNSLLVYMYNLNSPGEAASGVIESVGVRLRFDARKVLTQIELPKDRTEMR
jgi:hypothetical protein